MAQHVQIVLKHDVDHLGSTGDVVRVKPGFARNYLVPAGLASMATHANIKQFEHLKAIAQARAAKQLDQATGLAAALAEVTIRIEKQAGEEGKLYGSVTSTDVDAALMEKGYDIDKRKLVMPEEAIKAVGTYEVGMKLPSGVTAAFKLEVVAEA